MKNSVSIFFSFFKCGQKSEYPEHRENMDAPPERRFKPRPTDMLTTRLIRCPFPPFTMKNKITEFSAKKKKILFSVALVLIFCLLCLLLNLLHIKRAPSEISLWFDVLNSCELNPTDLLDEDEVILTLCTLVDLIFIPGSKKKGHD